MKNYKIKLLTILLVSFFIAPAFTYAGEIHYGSIEEVQGDSVHILYKGPSGQENFVCSAETTECVSHGTSTPQLFPKILEIAKYTNSPDGNYGLVEYLIEDIPYYLLYSFFNGKQEFVALLPYTEETTYIKFPWASDSVVLLSKDGVMTRYTIDTKELDSIDLGETSFSLKSHSPHGKYFSSYDYTKEAHVIWNIKNGEKVLIPSETPAYVEFSYDETTGVFMSTKDGYQTLYDILLANAFDGNTEPKKIFPEDFTVEDYLFLDNDLYFVANRESPLVWSLYRHNISTRTITLAVEDVSYGDYIRPIKGMMAFLKIDGKNANLSLFDPKTNSTKVISPVPASPASGTISRTEIDIAGVHGALLKPINDNSYQKKPLFIWLHGGPQRQTSIGYHSYLSYAVYDEMLERLVDSGAYVLKLDYTGSYGYGQEFIDDLTGNIGAIEVQNVIDATNELTQTLPVSDTYLIGNSYGGYLNMRTLVEQPDLFAGAVSINGVFDWFTLIRHIKSSPFKNYFDGVPVVTDETINLAMYLQASIYSKLPNLTDEKILLILGEEDSTVPTWQTEEFYYFSKGLNKNINLLAFPNEDHILRERANLNTLCSTIAEIFELDNVKCE